MSLFKSINLSLQEKKNHFIDSEFCKLKVHEIHASSFIHKVFCNRVENTVNIKQYLELKVPEKNLSLEREIN